MAKRRLTGFSRFLLAMVIIIPLAIIGSLAISGEDITVENITNPSTWTNDKNKDKEVNIDKPKVLDDVPIEEKKEKKVEEKTVADIQEEDQPKRNLKDLLKDKLNTKKDDPSPAVTENASVEVRDLQARINRLKDDLAEKDRRIESLYKKNESLENRYKSASDSLNLIKNKLDDLKRALN